MWKIRLPVIAIKIPRPWYNEGGLALPDVKERYEPFNKRCGENWVTIRIKVLQFYICTPNKFF